MKLISSVLLLAFFSATAVSIALGAELMHFMERSVFHEAFVFKERSPANYLHELIFSIKYKSLSKLQSILDQRSDPTSTQYRNWLTNDEVGHYVHNPSGIKAVSNWLKKSGIEISKTSIHGELIIATAPIGLWETLLNATFYHCHDNRRDRSLKRLHRSPEYWIPLHLKSYVSVVFNTVQIPPLVDSFHKSAYSLEGGIIENPHSSFQNSAVPAAPVTVKFLNNLYNVDSNIGDPTLTQAVIETADENYSPLDLKKFQSMYNLTQQNAININGHNISDCSTTRDVCQCGNRDIQFIMGMAQRTASIYWYSSYEIMDPFLHWILTMANTTNPPTSNSISWGAPEQLISASTLNDFNKQALKLAVQGVTIVVASGVAAASADCFCDEDSSSPSTWTDPRKWSGAGYFPSFPATSPYVTAVGATMGPQIGSAEVGCQSDQGGVVSSGGGFSTYFAQPSWQKSSVDYYFAHLPRNATPVAGYNRYGRGIPDVSLIGTNYEFIAAGSKMYLFGTACSAPVFAAFVSLVNAALKAVNKQPVGFLNPTLYSNKTTAIFRDITKGNNKCCSLSLPCCQSGFSAAPGWDAMTGLGSVDFSLFKSFYVKKDPTSIPTARPTALPTKKAAPTRKPTAKSTMLSSASPTRKPSRSPTLIPSGALTRIPSGSPIRITSTCIPSSSPTKMSPTRKPSSSPTWALSGSPTRMPSGSPTRMPSGSPTRMPSSPPTKISPTRKPSRSPTWIPSSRMPSISPTCIPSSSRTRVPSSPPTWMPSISPTRGPTVKSTTLSPTISPSSRLPSCSPITSKRPSKRPSEKPTVKLSSQPTATPTATPSIPPTSYPTSKAFTTTILPTTKKPSTKPSTKPITKPSARPTKAPR